MQARDAQENSWRSTGNPTTRLGGLETSERNVLGAYLRDRRAKLDPSAFGIIAKRRRTPGLRREEVAQRANVSATWYTWLEQGRGGVPSADVLERIAEALMLSAVEREHLFLLAQHRPPAVEYRPCESISAQLQRVLDSLEYSPAVVKTALWDIVGWNEAAATVLTNYPTIPPEERNILRMFFTSPRVRTTVLNWEEEARFVVAAFRSDVVRAGGSESVKPFIEELCSLSAEFAAIWSDYAVDRFAEGTKRLLHPVAGLITLEYSAFEVYGRSDLGLIIYTPATPGDRESVKAILESAAAAVS